MLDTRNGTGVTGGSSAPLGPNSTLDLDIDGQGSIPAGAAGVMLNVTAVGGSEDSWMVVYPKAASRPLASNLNWEDSTARPNLVSVPFGEGGDILFWSERVRVRRWGEGRFRDTGWAA